MNRQAVHNSVHLLGDHLQAFGGSRVCHSAWRPFMRIPHHLVIVLFAFLSSFCDLCSPVLPSLSLPPTSASSPSSVGRCSHIHDLRRALPLPHSWPCGHSLRDPFPSLQPCGGTLGGSLNLWVSQVWHAESPFFLLSSCHTCLSYTGPGISEASGAGWTPNPVLSTTVLLLPGTRPDSWMLSSCLPSLPHS